MSTLLCWCRRLLHTFQTTSRHSQTSTRELDARLLQAVLHVHAAELAIYASGRRFSGQHYADMLQPSQFQSGTMLCQDKLPSASHNFD